MSELKYIQNEIKKNREERRNKEREESLEWPDMLDPLGLNYPRYLKHTQFDIRDTVLINRDYLTMLESFILNQKEEVELPMSSSFTPILCDIANAKVKYNYDTPEIDDIIISDRTTTILWKDNTKSVVKCQKGDKLDKEKGVMLCYMNKILNKDYYRKLLKLVKRGEDRYKEQQEKKKKKLEKKKNKKLLTNK